MPTALLAGAYGQGNLGDDALLCSFKAALPGWRILATGCDQDEVRARGCLPVPARNPAAVARALLRADAVILGGGTVFKLLHPSTGRRPLGLLTNAAVLIAAGTILGRPVAAVGVGAGELTGWPTRFLVRSAIERSRLLVLRDEDSAQRLAAASGTGPFRVGADPSWSLLTPPDEARSTSKGPVRVVPSCLATGSQGPAEMVDRLVAVVHGLVAAGVAVQLQSWQHDPEPATLDDDAIVAEVARRGGSGVEIVERPPTLPEAVDSMRGLGAVVVFRFHALVAAGAAGVPAVAVSHEAKLSALAHRLGQADVAADYQTEELVALAVHAVRSPGPGAAVVKEQIDRAEEGFRLLRVLLAGGGFEVESLGALPLSPSPHASTTLQ
jgi:polysaccharide pyruvyl transferase WcaK-like protein